jgi:hypothetical protein
MKMNDEEKKNEKRMQNLTVAYLKANYPVLCHNGKFVRKAITGLSLTQETTRRSRNQVNELLAV